jgi:hypothetical protein
MNVRCRYEGETIAQGERLVSIGALEALWGEPGSDIPAGEWDDEVRELP